jgi:CarD family transcriptional regulator
MFKIGDLAVYPAHGPGVIEAIEKKAIGDTVYNFYMLRILETDYTIMVPTENAAKVGLRPLADKKEIREVWKILQTTDVPLDTQTWNRRQRDYNERVKTGSIKQLAEVLRDLYVLGRTKDLSYGERKMFELARTLLVGELAAASREKPEKIVKQIEALYDKK